MQANFLTKRVTGECYAATMSDGLKFLMQKTAFLTKVLEDIFDLLGLSSLVSKHAANPCKWS